ncbi:uncharacterized protein ppp1r3aa [Periophthalmus magnuspinnatus]|uniref:uncharacterized protein ppp1r3aa n=1 Tax=Periophthalmus magnuspinnatus TaxID=409849 RepID=UPI002436A1A6|nr:uncharacterized protein ppp1r3aa [Periophthalmus magnuspinnatus]
MFSCNQTPSVKSRPPRALPSTVSLQPGQGHSILSHSASQTESTKFGQWHLRKPWDIMEALCIQPGEVNGLNMEETEPAKSLEEQQCNSSTDDDDEEPQPPPIIRRKVSFADAFGLNLVSVKEFENIEIADLVKSESSDREEAISTEDFYMFCLFTVPPTPEELERKVEEQMVELESIELLPKTSTLRGIVRVLNMCYNKLVYVRITLDRWRSHFDLQAEYVPGSSDWKTDRFTFQYTLIPPFDKEGTRVEFCLRYETSEGVFWANNNQMNYVMFFHQKVKENVPQIQDENNHKSKKSCLKANRRESAEELIKEMLNAATYATECTSKTEAPDQPHRIGAKSTLHLEENKNTVESIKSRHRAARSARALDHCPQSRLHVPLSGYSHDLPQRQKGSQPISSAHCNSSSPLHPGNKAQTNSAQVLTYHQIPLATLDWSSDKPQPSGNDVADKTWTERAQSTLSKPQEESVNDTAAVTNKWETFANGTEKTSTKETTVFDVWQAFINGSDFATQSGVPESQCLQKVTPTPPSNKENPSAQCGTSRQVHVGPDTPNLEAASSNAHHLLSDTTETSLAEVALNGEDQEAAAALAYVTSPRDDNTGTQDAPQRSETNSVTETAQEFRLSGAPPVSKGSVDSPSESREHEIWEREGAGIMGGIGGDEPLTMHRADLVTSSGESQTTDMTAVPESANASGVDTISQGAGLQRGPSYSRDGKVTATAYNTLDDTLAFKETMRQGTADGERFVFSTRRQGAEEGLTTNCAGNKDSKKEEIVRPREIEKCQVSGEGGGGEQQRDFSRECDSLGQHGQNETVASHSDGLCAIQKCECCLESLCMDKEFNLEKQDILSNENRVEDKKEESAGHKPKIDTESKIMQVLDGVELPHKSPDSHNVLSNLNENIALFPEMNINQTQSEPLAEKLNDKDEIEESKLTGIETNVTGDGALQIEKDCCEIMQGRQEPREEIPPSVVTKEEPFSTTARTLEISQSATSPSLAKDEYNPEVVEISWTHSHHVITARKEDAGSRLSLEELVLKEKDAPDSLQPETLDGMGEDISQGDKDERLRIGKLEIAAMGEWMGNAENPRGESKNASKKLKELELSAEVESTPRVEYQKMSARTEITIRDDGVGTLEQEGDEIFLERFGQELVRTVWEEVFDCQFNIKAPSNKGEEGRDIDDSHFVRPLIAIDDKCVETLSADCKEGRPLERTEEEIELATNTNTSSYSNNDLNYASDSQSIALSTGSNCSSRVESIETKHRSVTLEEIDVKVEDGEVAYIEGCNKTPLRHPEASSRILNEVPIWWSILNVLFHITRLVICVLLVLGFFLIFFYYDFTTFFVLYSFSMCCWIYKWRSYQFIQKEKNKENTDHL